ncbi:hypothetical protein AG1IA_07902 [Rhizoctonia solani AG-1 IA]|uniref:Uncharacterized protein n=1 Tax=Thanatephorus cucumeris (strain AG1-IA) TaxID=983506 RepID=L8WJF7_THACA|nr:hypothetical protein AG1IA_07902 [Rhizoctonia solani AG-1 IA]
MSVEEAFALSRRVGCRVRDDHGGGWGCGTEGILRWGKMGPNDSVGGMLIYTPWVRYNASTMTTKVPTDRSEGWPETGFDRKCGVLAVADAEMYP